MSWSKQFNLISRLKTRRSELASWHRQSTIWLKKNLVDARDVWLSHHMGLIFNLSIPITTINRVVSEIKSVSGTLMPFQVKIILLNILYTTTSPLCLNQHERHLQDPSITFWSPSLWKLSASRLTHNILSFLKRCALNIKSRAHICTNTSTITCWK